MIKDISFLKTSLIAHRGMHNIDKGIPENSIPAFIKAINSNYIIELDVHILKDGTIVVFHDDNLKRMTGINKKIKNMSYDELKKNKLKNTKYTIPTLKEVLNLVNGKVPMLIELKYDTDIGILEKELIKILKDYDGKYAIQSFNPKTLKYFKKYSPETIRGQLYSSKIPKSFFRLVYFEMLGRPDFISQDIKMDRLNNKKLTLGWTIRKKEDMLDKRFDNYICENIEDYK